MILARGGNKDKTETDIGKMHTHVANAFCPRAHQTQVRP